MFDEHSTKAQLIRLKFEVFLVSLEQGFEVTFNDPLHDVAVRFMNEIKEYEVVGD